MNSKIVMIKGRQYKKVACEIGCRGCAFSYSNDTYAENCDVYKTVGCGNSIYKEVNTYKNMYVDLTWLKGTARTVIADAIQQRAINNGWHWHSTDGIINGWHWHSTDGWLVLRDDKVIEAWHDEHSPKGRYTNLHELSVNDALDGNYGTAEKRKPVVKVGDVVFSKGKFQVVLNVTPSKAVLVKNAWIAEDNYKLCRERKHFWFHEGQRVYRPDVNAYYTFLRYVSTTAECYSCQHELVNVDISKFVPASLKERYVVIK